MCVGRSLLEHMWSEEMSTGQWHMIETSSCLAGKGRFCVCVGGTIHVSAFLLGNGELGKGPYTFLAVMLFFLLSQMAQVVIFPFFCQVETCVL